jgi:hypothetical protein
VRGRVPKTWSLQVPPLAGRDIGLESQAHPPAVVTGKKYQRSKKGASTYRVQDQDQAWSSFSRWSCRHSTTGPLNCCWRRSDSQFRSLLGALACPPLPPIAPSP